MPLLARRLHQRGEVGVLIGAVAAWVLVALLPAGAGARLMTTEHAPFPRSTVITGARWTSPRYGPPPNQWGDIFPTVWADDGYQYAMVNDGATDVSKPGALWRSSVTRIGGYPPNIWVSHVGDPRRPPPHTFAEIDPDLSLWTGPLGPYYSTGLLAARHELYATQLLAWKSSRNGPFTGLAGIAYSRDHGSHWRFGGRKFPAPIGNLSFVVRGRGGVFGDGYAYAIGSEREFDADTMFMGRVRPDEADVTDPSKWQWLAGWGAPATGTSPVFSSSLSQRMPAISWRGHITYPQMSYDSPIHRYLLTFTYGYGSAPPAVWRDGSELVILEAPHPWGPFSFVAREPWFGPSNGYAAGFPIKWISGNGLDLWMKWSANFDGCSPGLSCSGAYGLNYRRLHLTVPAAPSSSHGH